MREGFDKLENGLDKIEKGLYKIRSIMLKVFISTYIHFDLDYRC